MNWNYRIIKHQQPAFFAVHEVFYDDNGKVAGWTADPIDITGETKTELLTSLKQITSDIKQSILEETKLLKTTNRKSQPKD